MRVGALVMIDALGFKGKCSHRQAPRTGRNEQQSRISGGAIKLHGFSPVPTSTGGSRAGARVQMTEKFANTD
jgi:hypothetical protein